MKDVKYYLDAAKAWQMSGEEDKAIESLSEAIELDNQHFGAVMQRGHAYSHKGQLLDAGADYKTASQIQPQNYLGHYHYGDVMAKSGNIKEACHAFQEALKWNPSQYTEKQIQQYIAEHCGEE